MEKSEVGSTETKLMALREKTGGHGVMKAKKLKGIPMERKMHG